MLIAVAGCVDSESQQIDAVKGRFLRQEALPEDTVAFSRVKKDVTESETGEVSGVVLRGRINAGELPPWEENAAAFVLTDSTGHDGDEEHDPHTCPFCSRNIRDYLARVVFADEQGQIINIDSRKLFGLRENQTVAVRGTISLPESDILLVKATDLYVTP